MWLKNTLKQVYKKYLIMENKIKACRNPMQIVKTIRNPDSNILAICHRPREHIFRGVRNVTLRNFENVWEFSTIYTSKQCFELANKIPGSCYTKIIFNDFTSTIGDVVDMGGAVILAGVPSGGLIAC